MFHIVHALSGAGLAPAFTRAEEAWLPSRKPLRTRGVSEQPRSEAGRLI